MAANDNLMDIVDRLERLIHELQLVLYGDKSARYPGLLDEIARLGVRLELAEKEIARLKRRRHNVLLWVSGFMALVAFVILVSIAFTNLASDANLLDIPYPIAGALAVFFAVVSLVLFLAGMGWMDSQ